MFYLLNSLLTNYISITNDVWYLVLLLNKSFQTLYSRQGNNQKYFHVYVHGHNAFYIYIYILEYRPTFDTFLLVCLDIVHIHSTRLLQKWDLHVLFSYRNLLSGHVARYGSLWLRVRVQQLKHFNKLC